MKTPADSLMRLETQRLLIRPFRMADLAAFAEIVGDPEVMRYIGDGSPLSPTQAQEHIEKHILSQKENGYSRYAVCLQESQQLIGHCGFMDFEGTIDFGWRYGRPYWGKGYATEAAQAVLGYARESLSFDRIVCLCYTDNVASLRVIQKLAIPFDRDETFLGRPVMRFVDTILS